ncbi:MAG: transketolase [Victivallaceae bacterium]
MLDAISKEIRRNCLRVAHGSGHGHLPTCFSVIEMIRAVYAVMRHDPAQPADPERDIFILSKGHAALAHYSVLAQLGYFPVDEVASFGAFQSRFGCHADRHKVPGVEWSTGSLGHGPGAAVGFALAIKLKHQARRVFVLIGDGESNEGSVWEAIQMAAHLKLDNLTFLLDWNRSQLRCLPISEPAAKFAAFGCRTLEVDGHDLAALTAAMSETVPDGRPVALVCRTGKGHGCATLLREMFAWHRRSPDAGELTMLLEELDHA